MSVSITKFEQSAFVLTINDERFAIDVGSEAKPADVLRGGPLKAVFVSHKHPDHFHMDNLEQLKAPVVCAPDIIPDLQGKALNAEQIAVGDRRKVGSLEVLATHADHGPISAPIDNLGFVFMAGGKKIFFAGDMRIETPVPDKGFDVVLVPVGDSKVFSPEMALSYVRSLGHRGTVIPMHFHGRADRAAGAKFKQVASEYCKPVVLDVGESYSVP